MLSSFGTMDKTFDDELGEAERMAEYRELGFPVEKIAERFGISPSTVNRRLKLWEKHLGEEREAAESERAKDATTILQTVLGIIKDKNLAEDIGKVTGANVSTIEGILKRISEGKATKQEVFNILSNFGGVVYGYLQGRDLFKRLKLPSRESLFGGMEEMKREIKEDVKKELKKEIAVAAGSGESKQEESEQEKKSKSKGKKKEAT